MILGKRVPFLGVPYYLEGQGDLVSGLIMGIIRVING